MNDGVKATPKTYVPTDDWQEGKIVGAGPRWRLLEEGGLTATGLDIKGKYADVMPSVDEYVREKREATQTNGHPGELTPEEGREILQILAGGSVPLRYIEESLMNPSSRAVVRADLFSLKNLGLIDNNNKRGLGALWFLAQDSPN